MNADEYEFVQNPLRLLDEVTSEFRKQRLLSWRKTRLRWSRVLIARYGRQQVHPGCSYQAIQPL